MLKKVSGLVRIPILMLVQIVYAFMGLGAIYFSIAVWIYMAGQFLVCGQSARAPQMKRPSPEVLRLRGTGHSQTNFGGMAKLCGAGPIPRCACLHTQQTLSRQRGSPCVLYIDVLLASWQYLSLPVRNETSSKISRLSSVVTTVKGSNIDCV